MPRNEKHDPIWFYFLIGVLTSIAFGKVWPQATPRTDTGKAAARAIIARHHIASGRINGQSRHRFTHSIAEFEAPAMKTVTETWAMEPDHLLTRITIEGAGTTEVGYNGKVGWTSTPFTGPMLLEGQQLKALAKVADGRALVDAVFRKLSVGPRAVVEGKEVVSVAFEGDEGATGTLFFDVKTGLLHAIKQPIPEARDGAMWTVITDYKSFNGELIPMTSTLKGNGQSLVTRTTHIDHKPVDTTLFSPPAAVRELMKRP